MRTGTDFADHRPHGDDARPDERFVRILLIEGREAVAEEIRQSLSRTDRVSFEVIFETSLLEAAARIHGEQFDLLLMDPQLPNIERSAALELASDFAHRLPVVVLTGTEAIESLGDDLRSRLSDCIEGSDISGKLMAAIRRSRRFGTGVMSPVFCRLEGLCL